MIDIRVLTGRMGNQMFQFAYLYSQVKDGVNPDWFLQDEKYFEKYAEDIKALFSQGIGYLDQVGVHIRRAANPINPDEPKYSENPFYVDLTSTDYYERAMALFPNNDFLIFSDDPEWCKEKFKDNKKVQVMNRGNEVEDFNLLSSCKNLIIANSSWSWWAAYLCPTESKRIIAPLKWFADGKQRVGIPESWEQI